MKSKRPNKKKLGHPRRVLRLPDLDHAKTAVLNTLLSLDSQRAYRFAMDDFIAWYCSEPRLAFKQDRCSALQATTGIPSVGVFDDQPSIGCSAKTGLRGG